MSNVEQLPSTLGNINKQLKALKAATENVWRNFTMLPEKTLYSVISDDISDVVLDFQTLEKQSRVMEDFSGAQYKLITEGPGAFLRQHSVDQQSHDLRGQGVNTERPAILIGPQTRDISGQTTPRQESAETNKNAGIEAINFAHPQLERAKEFLKPGAGLQAALSEVQSMLGLKNDDPRIAALRQQSLSMAASGHAPSEVVATQKKLAGDGLDASQVLAQTPAQLNGDTPDAQMAVTVKGDNLDGDITKLFATWETLRINLFEGQSSALRELTQTATGWLTTLNTWINDNPQLVNSLLGLALGITGIVGALSSVSAAIAPVLSGINMLMAGTGVLGPLFTSTGGMIAAAFAAIGLPLLPVIALIAGIGIAIVKLWEPISAFVSGLVAGFSSVIGPITLTFAPFKAALGWITDLFTPIKFTQDQLAGFSNVGKLVGEAIGEIFVTLTNAVSQIGEVFNWARKGVDSVLNIFSSDSDEPAENLSAPAAFAPNISPTGGMLSLYQPAKNSVANNLTDNRATTMNFSFTATPETDYPKIQGFINQAMNERDRNDENALHSQFSNGGFYS